MKVKKAYEEYIIHYMQGGELVSKLLKNLSQKEIDRFVAAGEHLKYFEPNGKKIKADNSNPDGAE